MLYTYIDLEGTFICKDGHLFHTFCLEFWIGLSDIDLERTFVWSYRHLFHTFCLEFWIGLSDIDLEGTFVWTDGDALKYNSWANSQPDNFLGIQNCGAMIDDGWDDGDCNTPHAYICESKFYPIPIYPTKMIYIY